MTPEQLQKLADNVRQNLLNNIDYEVNRAAESLGLQEEISDDEWQSLIDTGHLTRETQEPGINQGHQRVCLRTTHKTAFTQIGRGRSHDATDQGWVEVLEFNNHHSQAILWNISIPSNSQNRLLSD